MTMIVRVTAHKTTVSR